MAYMTTMLAMSEKLQKQTTAQIYVKYFSVGPMRWHRTDFIIIFFE